MSNNQMEHAGDLMNISNFKKAVLLLLRIAVGWHFLYEGVVKLFDPGWSSAGYLAESRWFL